MYDRLRQHAPLYRDEAYGRRVLTRFDDARHVLRSRDFGVDARKSLPESYMRRVAGTGVQEGVGATAYEPPLVLLDDPAHRRMRLLMSKAFTPKAVRFAGMPNLVRKSITAVLKPSKPLKPR